MENMGNLWKIYGKSMDNLPLRAHGGCPKDGVPNFPDVFLKIFEGKIHLEMDDLMIWWITPILAADGQLHGENDDETSRWHPSIPGLHPQELSFQPTETIGGFAR